MKRRKENIGELNEKACEALGHALQSPDEPNRWLVAADAAEEAGWETSTMMHYLAHLVRGKCILVIGFDADERHPKYDDAGKPLVLWLVNRTGRSHVCTVASLAPTREEVPPHGRTDRRPERSWHRSVYRDPNPVDSRFVNTQFLGFAGGRLSRFVIPSDIAYSVRVDDVRINGNSLLSSPIPGAIFTETGIPFDSMRMQLTAASAIEIDITNTSDEPVNMAMGAIARTMETPPLPPLPLPPLPPMLGPLPPMGMGQFIGMNTELSASPFLGLTPTPFAQGMTDQYGWGSGSFAAPFEPKEEDEDE